jgi:hypothetical protein
MKIEEADNMVVTVRTCARCGGDHTNLEFKKLTRIQDEWTHWAKCPNIGEPIMLKIVKTPEEPVFPSNIILAEGESPSFVP